MDVGSLATANTGCPFDFADAANRVAQWNSENSGDIILLPNMQAQYYFDKADQ